MLVTAMIFLMLVTAMIFLMLVTAMIFLMLVTAMIFLMLVTAIMPLGILQWSTAALCHQPAILVDLFSESPFTY